MKKRNVAIAIGGGLAAAVAVKMLTRAKTVDWNSVADDIVHANHSHFISIEGIRLHFQEFGEQSAPAIILIHGYTASLYVWKTVAPMLADAGFRVIAIDMPGFGYSEKPKWFDYSIPSQAHVIERFMDRLGIGRAVIIGSSYGGAVAATIALDYGERVEKLVLVDPVTNDHVKNHPILRIAAVPGFGEVITPFLVGSRAFMKMRMHRTLAPTNHDLITNERLRNIQRPINAADGHHAVLATSRNWHANRIERDAGLIHQPTLLIWGDQDRVIPIENGYKLYNSVLHSRLVVLKDCGHVPQEEKSEIFAELVTEFCRDKKGRIGEREGADITLP